MTAPTVVQDGQPKIIGTSSRIWRLQYGPCWCGSVPSDSGSFDYVRVRRSSAHLGSFQDHVLIVSDRVIDGAARMYRSIHSEVPDPKLVIAVGSCPNAERFWDELPNGWTEVEDILAVDIRVEECINGYPEALMAALLGHIRAPEEESAMGREAMGLET